MGESSATAALALDIVVVVSCFLGCIVLVVARETTTKKKSSTTVVVMAEIRGILSVYRRMMVLLLLNCGVHDGNTGTGQERCSDTHEFPVEREGGDCYIKHDHHEDAGGDMT